MIAVEHAVNLLEKQLKGLEEVESWTNTIQSNSLNIIKRTIRIREETQEQIDHLRVSLEALATES